MATLSPSAASLAARLSFQPRQRLLDRSQLAVASVMCLQRGHHCDQVLLGHVTEDAERRLCDRAVVRARGGVELPEPLAYRSLGVHRSSIVS